MYQGFHLLTDHHHQMFCFACIALQNRIAKLFDKEAALFVPTGTMGNLISGQYQCFINFVAVYKGSNSSKFAAIFMMHWNTKI